MIQPLIEFEYLQSEDGKKISFASGEAIFHEGSEESEAYFIAKGRVEIRKGDHVLEVAGPGMIVGEMALIDPNVRSAGAVAVEDVELIPIGRRKFLYLIAEQPKFALNMLRLLSRRLRSANVT